MQNRQYLFSQLSDEDIDWLAGIGYVRPLVDREQIINVSEALMSVFIVLDGSLTVLVDDREVSALNVGEIVGEMSLVDARPTSADVRARGPARVLEVEKADLVVRLHANTGFAARFYRAVAMALSDRLRGLLSTTAEDESVRSDRIKTADRRFARLLEAVR